MASGDFNSSDSADFKLDLTNFVSNTGDGLAGGFARGAERDLLAALFFDGVQAFVHYKGAQTERAKSRHHEAFRWVASRRTDYAFSFDNVCAGLGLSADYVRSGLLGASAGLLQKLGKYRRNA